MPPKRRKRFQGLYYHSSPPKVLPMNGQTAENQNVRKRREYDDFSVKLSTIRIWIHEKDIGKLTRILWAGQGHRLSQQVSNNARVKRFLVAVPHVMNAIKEVHQAVIDNNLETLQAKLEPPVPPALVTCRDANGLNIIHKAAGLGYTKILEYLIGIWPEGAHETDITGKTPLHWAASAKNNMRCYTLLTQAGCDEEATDYKSKTPSYYRHKPHEIERAFLVYVPDAPRVSPDATTDWEALSDDCGDGKKLDIKIPDTNGLHARTNEDNIENTTELDAHDDGVSVNGETEMADTLANGKISSQPPTPEKKVTKMAKKTVGAKQTKKMANTAAKQNSENNTRAVNELKPNDDADAVAEVEVAPVELENAKDAEHAQNEDDEMTKQQENEENKTEEEKHDKDEVESKQADDEIENENDDDKQEDGENEENEHEEEIREESKEEKEEETEKENEEETKEENEVENKEENELEENREEVSKEENNYDNENEADNKEENNDEAKDKVNGNEEQEDKVNENADNEGKVDDINEDNEDKLDKNKDKEDKLEKNEDNEDKNADNEDNLNENEENENNLDENSEINNKNKENSEEDKINDKTEENTVNNDKVDENEAELDKAIENEYIEDNDKDKNENDENKAKENDINNTENNDDTHDNEENKETEAKLTKKTDNDINESDNEQEKEQIVYENMTTDKHVTDKTDDAAVNQINAKHLNVVDNSEVGTAYKQLANSFAKNKQKLFSAGANKTNDDDDDDDEDVVAPTNDEDNDDVNDDEHDENGIDDADNGDDDDDVEQYATDMQDEPNNIVNDNDDDDDGIQNYEDNDSGDSPTSSLAIEGFVQGESDDNTVQSQTAAYVDEETRIQNIIASGDMEQLAEIVLNGDGNKLLGMQAKEPEIQAFLNNVPTYMSKIRRVHDAARDGSLLALQQALDRQKFAIAKDEISPNGATPLHVAVIFGNNDILRYLAARFPETLTATDNDGRTALHYAASLSDNGHFYNILLHLGANPKLLDKLGHTPEFLLNSEKSKDILNYRQLLSSFGAEELENRILSDQGQVENQSFQTNPIFKTEQGKYLADSLADPLIKALTEIANKRPTDPVKYLAGYLQNYARQPKTEAMVHSGSSKTSSTAFANSNSTPKGNVKHSNGTSVNDDVIENDDPAMVENGDEPATQMEERDEHGQSMLHFACARSHRRGAIYSLIEESNIDITYRDELYRTARDVALQANQVANASEIDRYVISLAVTGDVKPFEHLALQGYDHILDVIDENEKSIADIAAERQHEELADYLKNLRSLEETREELHQMIRDKNIERIKEIAAGPNGKWLIKTKNYYGRTALHIAVLKEMESIVEHFIKVCPEALKVSDNLERTVLHYAMGTIAVENLSRILIQNGAKRTSKDLKGRQPSYYFMNKADILRLQEEEDENR